MNTETKIDIFAACSILLFGTLLGGLMTYQHFDDRISTLEDQSFTGSEGIVEEDSLVGLFSEVEESVVSVETIEGGEGQGSGFVYDNNGHIVTNEHVIRDAETVRITFTDGTTENAEIIGTDPDTDLAVLRTSNTRNPLELSDSNDITIGQTAIAIGNPFGLESSMTSGIISQTERQIRIREGFSVPNVIQTDAAINPGNSGGPLMNINGEVIGVNTAIESQTGTFSGIGFAISSNTVEEVVPKLIEEGQYQHPWIGIEGLDVSAEIAEAKEMDRNSGFVVLSVVEGSPAEDAGLQGGQGEIELRNGQEANINGSDIIVGIEGNEVHEINDIIGYLLTEKNVGEEAELQVLRDGEVIDVTLELARRP